MMLCAFVGVKILRDNPVFPLNDRRFAVVHERTAFFREIHTKRAGLILEYLFVDILLVSRVSNID